MLDELKDDFEIGIFTAGKKSYADPIIDRIDKDKRISFRLYRKHNSFTGKRFIKDLSRLGRDLRRTIIVDNVAENFQKQPDNGIFIKSWYNDPEDTALKQLVDLLRTFKSSEFDDVTKFIKHMVKKRRNMH